MFLHILDEEQIRGFFALASRMIAADKVVADSEVDYLNELIKESGLAGKQPLRDKGKEVDLSIYDDRRTQLAVAMELLILANTDRYYDPKELIYWDDILNRFDFSKAEQEHIRANAEIAALLLKNVEDLISGYESDGMTEEERRNRADRRRNERRGPGGEET